MEPLVFLFIFFGVSAGITYCNYSHYKGLLSGVIPCIEDPQILGLVTPRIVGRYRDHSLSLTIMPGGKNSPPRLTMCLYAVTPFQLHIYREGTLQKVGKKLGLLEEIEIGIPYFDRNFLIQTASASRARAYLCDVHRRKKIEFLFNSGYHDFKVVEGALLIEKRSDDMGHDLEPQTLRAILDDLVYLAGQL